MNHNKQSRPRALRGVQALSNRRLAELTAVLESELLGNMKASQHPEQLLRYRLAAIKRALPGLRLLFWCWSELARRDDSGALAKD